jgi:hypothetical protein
MANPNRKKIASKLRKPPKKIGRPKTKPKNIPSGKKTRGRDGNPLEQSMQALPEQRPTPKPKRPLPSKRKGPLF